MKSVIFAAAIASAAAFAPSTGSGRMATSVAATSDRRDALNNIAKLVGGAIVTVGGSDPAFAVSNPALETFKKKGRKSTDGTFVPGKGMRQQQSFDELMAVSNPALETFKKKGRKSTDGTFVPGKGMRTRTFFDELA